MKNEANILFDFLNWILQVSLINLIDMENEVFCIVQTL